MSPEFLVAYISIGSVLIPLSIALVLRKRIPTELKPLCWILVIALVCDMVSFIFIRYSLNTLLVTNIYWLAQFTFLMWIFSKQFKDKRFIHFVYIFFILFYAVNILFFQGPWVSNSVSNVLASLILIPFCLHFFYRLLNDLPTVNILSLPMLWISFAVLTYYAGNFFLFLVSNYLIEEASEAHRMLWILHNLLNITKNILFAIALWLSYRKVKSFTLLSSAP